VFVITNHKHTHMSVTHFSVTIALLYRGTGHMFWWFGEYCGIPFGVKNLLGDGKFWMWFLYRTNKNVYLLLLSDGINSKFVCVIALIFLNYYLYCVRCFDFWKADGSCELLPHRQWPTSQHGVITQNPKIRIFTAIQYKCTERHYVTWESPTVSCWRHVVTSRDTVLMHSCYFASPESM
jgi:hypothetical protein